jgi:signal transduction histidine kinase
MDIDENKPVPECVTCQTKDCEKSSEGELGVCPYGIAHIRIDGEIRKKREHVTKIDLATNMRHELSRVLQYIISQAEELDENVSTRRIDMNSPASRIVGATTILDYFIEMLCGVYHFHPAHSTRSIYESRSLRDTVQKHLDTYSLIKNTRRLENLQLILDIPPDLRVSIQTTKVDYIVAILCDNLWKYSNPDYPVKIYLEGDPDSGVIDLCFSNCGDDLSDRSKIFDLGYQLDKKSEGFGYGLSWAQVLAYQYNLDLGTLESDTPFAVIHESTSRREKSLAHHTFRLQNLKVD